MNELLYIQKKGNGSCKEKTKNIDTLLNISQLTAECAHQRRLEL